MVQYDGNGTPKKAPLSLQIDLARFEPATEEEKRQQDVMSKSTSFLRDGLRRLFKNPLAVGSLIMLFLIVAVILIAPLVVPYGYSEILSVNGKRDKGAKNMAPFTYSEMEQEYIANGGERFPHIFGTDDQCRDYFIRVVYGTRVSLAVGFFASIIVLIIGLIYGSISGYVGGKVDLVMMRIVDIIYSLPDMLMVILLRRLFDRRAGAGFPAPAFCLVPNAGHTGPAKSEAEPIATALWEKRGGGKGRFIRMDGGRFQRSQGGGRRRALRALKERGPGPLAPAPALFVWLAGGRPMGPPPAAKRRRPPTGTPRACGTSGLTGRDAPPGAVVLAAGKRCPKAPAARRHRRPPWQG